MSRKIKFRAWSDSNNAFIFRGLFDRNWHNERDLLVQVSLPHDRQMYTLEQFTGLLDKKSVEIYEGDIVEYLNGEWSFHAVVEWSDHYWYMRGVQPVDNFNFEDTTPGELAVVGNIHENPDLLE
ncbi:hypothetical protein GSU68_09905 [Rathayibacter sp. VKM Ac-2759]|uniref:YopX family protein n=1 Tax=Rathayibacter sp. VKM Ac-2759 TaxID=2609252 RepID=UPI0013169E43|nr:YopX family protein [Rathayibacter sp. VKM Ac-2759]QHC66842.1 hypothetical protein GSU68_09905 [Rathayibacter sp. VKM Ac-2759]